MKIPAAETRCRLEYVEGLYLGGHSERSIQRRASQKFGIRHRAVRRYLQRVRERLAKLPKPPPEAGRARAEALLLRAYRTAERGGEKGPQASAMVSAAARLAELDGLLTKHVDHSGSVATVSPDDVLRAIQERRARRARQPDAAGAGGPAPGGPGPDPEVDR